MRVQFHLQAAADVPVRLVTWRGGRGFARVSRVWPRGSGGQLIPLEVTGELRELDIRLPAGGCVTGLAVGRLRYTHST
jgi:hypothetical protein